MTTWTKKAKQTTSWRNWIYYLLQEALGKILLEDWWWIILEPIVLDLRKPTTTWTKITKP